MAGIGAGLTFYALASVGNRSKLSRTLLLSSVLVGAVSFHAAGYAVSKNESIFTKPVEDEKVLRALRLRQVTHALNAQGFNQHVDIVAADIEGHLKPKPL